MIQSKNPIITDHNYHNGNFTTIPLTLSYFRYHFKSYGLNLLFFSTFVPGKSFTTSSL